MVYLIIQIWNQNNGIENANSGLPNLFNFVIRTQDLNFRKSVDILDVVDGHMNRNPVWHEDPAVKNVGRGHRRVEDTSVIVKLSEVAPHLK